MQPAHSSSPPRSWKRFDRQTESTLCQRRRKSRLVCSVAFLLLVYGGIASQTTQANESTISSFIDIQSYTVSFDVDFQQQAIGVHVSIRFSLPEPGKALFDLKPATTRFRIGTSGAWINSDLPSVEIQRRQWRTLPHLFEANTLYMLEAEYELTPANTPRCRFECSIDPRGSTRRLLPATQFMLGDTFVNSDAPRSRQTDGVDFLMAVMDYDVNTYRTEGRTFLERYIPMSLESDQFPLAIHVTLPKSNQPDATRTHRVMANGTVDTTQTGFSVTYSKHSTCSSVYFHLVPIDRYYLSESIISVHDKNVPVAVYSMQSAGESFHAKVKDKASKYVKQFGKEIGFYPHDAYVAHLYPRSGGMEYSGATSCNPGSLAHEVMHSWWGRGAKPVDGNAGWIDEAVTVWWVDSGGRLSTPPPSLGSHSRRSSRPLAVPGEYRRMTSALAYSQGSRFISYVASHFQAHGVAFKPVLVKFLRKYMHATYTTEQFLDHLQSHCPAELDLQPAIDFYVYGK